MTTTITRLDPSGILKAARENPRQLMVDAYKAGFNISGYLERLNPSENGSKLDAFGRVMKEAGIVTRSDPQAGYWASPAVDFYEDAGRRFLFAEFFAREWRKVVFEKRATYLSTDGTPGSWQRPYAEAAAPRWDTLFAPAIPLSELIAITTPISGQDYRSFYLTYDATQLRKFRVGESSDIPIAKLTDSENTIQAHKYGRGLQASYEQLRRMRVDKLAFHVRAIAVQNEADKVDAALDVLVNGDGNTGTAATVHNLTTLDTGATAGTLTLKGWLAFKLKFANPYMITTALMQEATALQLILLDTGSTNIPLGSLSFAGLQPQNLAPINRTADGVRYGWLSSAPALQIVGFDSRIALEQITEIGGMVDEVERFITNQTQVLTMTEVQGFAILQPGANLILDVNA